MAKVSQPKKAVAPKSEKTVQQKPRRKDQLNFFIGERLHERACAYEEKSGLKIAAQCRIGLDMLLKQNNF